MKQALICGISGQDGAYLAKHLLELGYAVCGTSRDAQISSFQNLKRLGIWNQVKLVSMSLTDFRSVLQVFTKIEPDEVYNLAGQSSVGLSFELPVETMESFAIGTLNLLEVIRFLEKPIKLYNASSSECFGDTKGEAANEETPFRPRSPYGVAKAAAFWEVANYREAYNLFACSGILFNHESPLRPQRFVTQKIVSTVCRIATGSNEKLYLGNIDIQRDWGWALEYVNAMHLMLQHEVPDDYVIATGKSYTLQQFVDLAFKAVNLNWQEHVVIDRSLFRPSEIAWSCGNPAKAEKILGWKAQSRMPEVVTEMVRAHLNLKDAKPPEF
ncbi:GDP-mannose 4,6-dehydratase [Pseudanabaena sp. FACHB-2040]|uniref:GDP-mannose 4,6-dehydratase n=1 Tax=Pseudanabaena sp. FACHB-2040 TaxID=2692859 RepID=UPI00168A2A22|nr:GDP-mannose 4,6-dehydratase [Pseudanabaena sp. FACHB-2040]MBD2260599.1 GDP-mannose 4,6-dehydratase [Pseudanabaena sp. FACHB-2040]